MFTSIQTFSLYAGTNSNHKLLAIYCFDPNFFISEKFELILRLTNEFFQLQTPHRSCDITTNHNTLSTTLKGALKQHPVYKLKVSSNKTFVITDI
jgi:hypothetical protein